MNGYANFNLKKLAGCDPYGEVVFDLEYCKLLNKELPELFQLVKERKLLDPSSINKFDERYEFWDEGPEILIWDELEIFLRELQPVIAKAIEQNRSIIVVGD